jgi:hypothetical protein
MSSTCLTALRQVLAWATEQGMTVHGQLDEAQLAALVRVFDGEEAWSFDLYQPLRALGYALSRLDLPDMPAHLGFADTLWALDELRAAALPAWPTHEEISELAFSEMGYASTSAAITRVRDANAAAWREHAANNRRVLMQGAELARGSRAVVVGAGKLYDIPLRQLAERFEQLVLVDIDPSSLAESVKQVGLPPELRSRLALVRTDVTGINDVFLEKAQSALSRTEEAEVYDALLRLLHEYRLDEPPRLFPAAAAEGDLDFACSSMVLSQLATPLTGFVLARFEARFPASQRPRSPEFQLALSQFTHRVQLAHVRSLLRAAPLIALTSDVADQVTVLDGHGNVARAPVSLPLVGAPLLETLVPRLSARAAPAGTWEWRHVVPTRSKPRGHTLQVSGVVARRR